MVNGTLPPPVKEKEEQDVLLGIVTYCLLALLFFGLAATVETGQFKSRFKEGKGIACGLCCQFFIVPFLGFLSCKLFKLDAVYGITLLILCSSPGGSYSNWWCSLFNADLALSVAMTTCSTFAAMVMLPINTLIYVNLAYGGGDSVEIDWVALALSLAVTIVGISAGLYSGAKFPNQRNRFNGLGQIAGLVLMGLSFMFSSERDPIWNREANFYAATSLPCVSAVLISMIVTGFLGLRKPERVAVVIETAYQNIGLATSIAINSFNAEDGSRAAGIPVLYGAWRVP